MTKALTVLVVASILICGWLLWYVDTKQQEFKQQCHDAGGTRVIAVGRSLVGFICVTADGRIIPTGE